MYECITHFTYNITAIHVGYDIERRRKVYKAVRLCQLAEWVQKFAAIRIYQENLINGFTIALLYGVEFVWSER